MARSYTVLLVEDHEPLRQCLAELLQARGWQIYATGKGQKAVELAQHHSMDFSILDMHLPGISGLQVFQTISQKVGPLPAIMMSGEASSSETHAALQAGIFTFLRKPLDLNHLEVSLNRLIQHHFGTQP